jgi:hypothetical protein
VWKKDRGEMDNDYSPSIKYNVNNKAFVKDFSVMLKIELEIVMFPTRA